MKNTLKILITASVAIITIALLPFYINLLTNNEEVIKYSNNLGFFRLTIIVGIMIFLALALTLWLTRKQDTETSQTKNNLPEDIEPDVKKLLYSLKERYQKRYESKLDERFEIKLEISEDWQGNKTQTFNERYDKDAKISEAFERLKELLDTKDGLLIVGEPGAGKTVLLLKVALNLLNKTNLADKEAFPVIFNLASWNAEYKDFGEWLKAMLVSGNGLSKDFADRLLREKRFILLLDGLDELARNEEDAEADKKRAACLESLNNYLDGEKTVICCRIDEFAAMQKNTAQDAPVSAKVEVLNLTEAELLNALEHAQNHADTKHHASARTVSELLAKDKNAALRKILCTPFYFTIALEVFYKRLPDEINLPHDEKELATYLIEKYVERKLKKTPNSNKFAKGETKSWLKWLAKLMKRKQSIIFELTDLQPKILTPSWTYNILLGVIVGLIIFSILNFIFSLGDASIQSDLRTKDGLRLTILIIIFVPSIFYGFRSNTIKTKELSHFSIKPLLDLRVWTKILTTIGLWEILISIIFLGMFWVDYERNPTIMEQHLSEQFGYLKTIALVIFSVLLCEQILEYSRLQKKIEYIESPYKRLNSAIIFSLLKWSIAITFTFFIWKVYRYHLYQIYSNNSYNIFYIIDNYRDASIISQDTLGLLVVINLVILPISLFNLPLFKHIILRLILNREGSMPLRYATFLDYAAEARILEKDGGQWRFRHQNLQEYFANLAVEDKNR